MFHLLRQAASNPAEVPRLKNQLEKEYKISLDQVNSKINVVPPTEEERVIARRVMA